jgi:aryl-alcohol dehydrogenase-like predicted oxidoreductase
VGQEPETPGDFDGPVEGLSAPVIRRELERSRERIGLDIVDVYWAHGEDRRTDLAETVAAMGDLVTEGVVRRLGVSNALAGSLPTSLSSPGLCCSRPRRTSAPGRVRVSRGRTIVSGSSPMRVSTT